MALSEFEWTEEAQGAMDLLKHLVSTAVPVRMLDYELAHKVKQPDQRESEGCGFSFDADGHMQHSVRACPRLGAYVTSRYLWSSNMSTRGHSRGMGPC